MKKYGAIPSGYHDSPLYAASLHAVKAEADKRWPKAIELIVRTDRTSDGTIWGPGKGEVVAIREHGKWIVF